MLPGPPCQPLGTDVSRTYPASRSCRRPRLPRHMTGSITITTAEDFSCWAAPRQVCVRLRGDDTRRRHLHSAHACYDPPAAKPPPACRPQLRPPRWRAPGRCPLTRPGTCVDWHLTIVHPRPPHRRSRLRSKGRNVPGSAQCGSPRRSVPSCCCSCWSSSWETASARHQRLRCSRAPAAGTRAPAGWRPGNAARRDRSARAQGAAAERGTEIARSDPKRGAAQSRWCRRQNPPSQAACGSQGRAT